MATPSPASPAMTTEGPILVVGPYVAGVPTRVLAQNGPPGQTLHLVASTAGEGAGPCPPPAGGLCLDVLTPRRVATMPLNGAGTASTMVSIPPLPAGSSLWLQGLVVDGADSTTTPVHHGTYVTAGAGCVGLGGTLSADLTLTAADGTCTLTSDLIVSPGVTLELQAGTTLLADPGVELEVKGHLQVDGNEAAPVVLGSTDAAPAAGSWQGLAFRETGTGHIQGADIAHAVYAVYSEGLSPTLEDTVLRDSTYGAYYDDTGGGSIVGGAVTGNDIGIYASWSTVDIDRVDISFNRIGAQGGSASTFNIENATVVGNTETGIQPDGGTIAHSVVSGNGTGIATTTGWNTIAYNRIQGNDVGVLLGGYPVRKTLEFNHLIGNTTYAVQYDGGYDDGTVDAEHNWWGTTDLALVDAAVYDVYDDITKFQVDVVPMLTGPHPGVGPIPQGWEDADGDGFASFASGGNDCDDGNSSVRPLGLDDSADGVDSDCDGAIDEDVLSDVDGDGYWDDEDCDDGDSAIHPGAVEVPANGTDEDCNGFDLVPPSGSTLSGVLVGDVLLTAAGSPYLVDAGIAVPPVRTLQAEPGVEVRFDPATDLLVKGTFIAEGASGLEVVLTSSAATPAKGDWGGVVFEGGAGGSLAHVNLSYAGTGLRLDNAGPSLRDLVIEQCGTGLDIYDRSTTLASSWLLSNDVGAYVSWATLTVTDGVISENGTGLDGGSASTLDVHNTRIDRNTVGVHPDGGTVDHCDIQGNDIGIDTGTGWFTVTYSAIQENRIGLVLGGYPTRKAMHFNSFDNNTEFAVQYVGGYSDGEVDATQNHWGNILGSVINETIWDVRDDIDLFEVVYQPFLNNEHVGTGLIPSGSVDADGDGYDDIASGGNDCDDSDPNIKPEGLDDVADGIDSDCDGFFDEDVPKDLDGDGYLDDVDCDDLNPDVHPDAAEVPRDGIDDDCNGDDLDDPPSGTVDGVLGQDTILAAGTWVNVTGLAVPPGVTVVIEPGAEVRFPPATKFRVKGTLLSQGSAASPVWIGADSGTVPGSWGGMTVEGPQATVDLANTLVQYADVGLQIDEGSATLVDSELADHFTGLDAYSPGTALLQQSTVARCDLGATIAWGTLSVIDSTVEDCGTGIAGGSASTLDVNGALVQFNGVGISPDGGNLTHSHVHANGIGIDTGTGWLTMSFLEITDNGDGVVLGGYPVRKTLNYSNLTGNTGYAVRYSGGYDDGNVDCTSNWWGSTDPAVIAAAIWDFDDDPALFPVDTAPVLASPEPTAGP